MKESLFYFIVGGFLVGILTASFIKISFLFFVFITLIFSGIFLFLYFRAIFRQTKENHYFSFVFIIFISFTLGIFRFNLAENNLNKKLLPKYEEKYVSVIGIVSEEPAIKNGISNFKLDTYFLSLGSSTEKILNQNILIRLPFAQKVFYGDEVVILGKLEKIQNFYGDNGYFNYVSYLKKDGVNYQIENPEMKIVSKDGGNFLIKNILFVKEYFIRNIANNLGEPDASLVSGMLLSGKVGLNKDLQDDFIKAGIIHVVVLSGYNIAIIIAVLLSIFSFVRRQFRILIILSGVSIFVIMSGGSAPVVRAAIMALIVFLAKNSSRKVSAFRALALSALVMVAINPFILAFDPSFILSFMATFAVIFVAPIIKEKILFVPNKYKMREIISETLGTQIFLLPFLLYNMGIFSSIALPVNILILPLVSLIMFAGFFVGILGFLPPIVFPFAFISHILVTIMLFIVKVFLAIPFSFINISNISVYIPLVMYISFFIYFLRLKGFRFGV